MGTSYAVLDPAPSAGRRLVARPRATRDHLDTADSASRHDHRVADVATRCLGLAGLASHIRRVSAPSLILVLSAAAAHLPLRPKRC